jgi:hypothetical protein
MNRGLLFLAAGGSLLLAACDDSLLPVALVESARPLGARVEVDGDPVRAVPLPGESAALRLLVAAPDPAQTLGYAVVACERTPGTTAIPDCASEPFASAYDAAPAPLPPRFEFSVPDGLASDAGIALFGVACPDGSPVEGSVPPRCERAEGERRLLLSLDLPGDGEPNRNPTFDADAVTLDGEVLESSELPDAPCQGLGLVEVAAHTGHDFSIGLPDAARDLIPAPLGGTMERESIQLSHFTSAGKLERAFTNFGPSADEIRAELRWDAPKEAPEGGALVRFWLVARDYRGGGDFIERAVCLVP